MRSVTHFLRYSSLKCSKQTFTVRSVIVNSFTLSVFASEAIEETEKKLFLSCGRFHSLLVAFRNSKTRRHSEQTRPSTKQDFSEEALSKQNTEASLASLSYSSRAPTEWSAIFAFGVCTSRIYKNKTKYVISKLEAVSIHRMQIWRTTQSAPGTSCMKVRLVSPWCFVLTILPLKNLASWTV